MLDFKKIFTKKISLISMVLFGLILVYAIYLDFGEKERYSETLRYLTTERGYKGSDIESIEVEHSLLNLFLSYEEWVISVVFKDEPEATYFYLYDHGKILQAGLSGSTDDDTYRHLEDKDKGEKSAQFQAKRI